MTGPQDWLTTGGLIAATACGIAACAAALRRLKRGADDGRTVEWSTVTLATLLCAAVFIYRALAVHKSWAPLQSHVDGLSLLSALAGVVVLWSYGTGRLRGLSAFFLPVMVLMMIWGVCAGWWSWRAFDIRGVWSSVHLVSVYVGTLAIAAAGAAGAMWLFVDRQLKARDHQAQRLKRLGALANLESIEAAVIHAATVGFILITIGLITGLIVITDGATRLGAGWWYSPKVLLATVVWVIYALVMHVRFVPTFRGRRAAVLAIVGLVLLIIVMGIAQTLPGIETQAAGHAMEARGFVGDQDRARCTCTCTVFAWSGVSGNPHPGPLPEGDGELIAGGVGCI